MQFDISALLSTVGYDNAMMAGQVSTAENITNSGRRHLADRWSNWHEIVVQGLQHCSPSGI
jgi:hypothetical protein